MTANRQLAEARGISTEDIETIDKLHIKLEKLLDTSSLGVFNPSIFDEIELLENEAQRLWKFPEDKRFHTWAPRYAFLCNWFGRTFRCLDTGETITLGKDIYPKQFISFGKCAIDLGVLNGYSRKIGNIQEIS